MNHRLTHEIVESKAILEKIIEKPVTHFCWPGGAYNESSWATANDAGYETICVARNDHSPWLSEETKLVRRIGCHYFVSFRGKTYRTNDPHLLLLGCEIELGHSWKKWPSRWRKAVCAIKDKTSAT